MHMTQQTENTKKNPKILRHTQSSECWAVHKLINCVFFSTNSQCHAQTAHIFLHPHALRLQRKLHIKRGCIHACVVGLYSLLSIFRGGIAGIGSRGCVRVCVCIGVRGASGAEFFQCAGGTYGPDHQAWLSLQVKTLQVAHHCIPTHLQYLKPYFPLQFSWIMSNTQAILTTEFPLVLLKKRMSVAFLTRHKGDEPLASFIGSPGCSDTVYPLVLWIFIHYQLLHKSMHHHSPVAPWNGSGCQSKWQSDRRSDPVRSVPLISFFNCYSTFSTCWQFIAQAEFLFYRCIYCSETAYNFVNRGNNIFYCLHSLQWLKHHKSMRHTAEKLDPARWLSEAVRIIEQLHFDKDIDLSSDT